MHEACDTLHAFSCRSSLKPYNISEISRQSASCSVSDKLCAFAAIDARADIRFLINKFRTHPQWFAEAGEFISQ